MLETLGHVGRRSILPMIALASTAFFFIINFTGLSEPTFRGHPIDWEYIVAVGVLVFAFLVGLTFYRYQVELDERGKYEAALVSVESLMLRGTELLNEVGYDRSDMLGYTSPKGGGAGYSAWFSEIAHPKLLDFSFDLRKELDAIDLGTRYRGTLNNIGNVLRGTDDKPALIQSLEGWLKQLQKIADDLRTHL